MGLRITDGRMNRSMSHLLGAAMGRMDKLQRQVATGKRLDRPSDDPLATTQAQTLQARLQENKLFQNNVADALSWTGATEPVLNTMHDILTRLEEFVLRGGDDANPERGTIAESVDDLLDEMVTQANSSLGDRYLFAGYDDRTPPYVASKHVAGETVTLAAPGTAVDLVNAHLTAGSIVLTDPTGGTVYQEGVDYSVDTTTGRLQVLAGGSLAAGMNVQVSYDTEGISSVQPRAALSGDMVRQLGRDRTMIVNLTGPQVFADGGDLFQLAIDIRNALLKGDTAQVRSLGTSVEGAISHMGVMLGLVGSRSGSLESEQNMLEADATSLQKYLGNVEDADVADVMMRLQAEQTAYQAGLVATARIMQLGLAQHL
jgi:flagellar hook-associated protein 3 FlgL